MSDIFNKIKGLIENKSVIISSHGYDELAEDGIFIKDIMKSVKQGKVVEEYPDYFKGPCVLVLQKDSWGNAIHVVWGIPKGKDSPAVLVTSYKPDPSKWTDDFMERRK